MRNVGKVKNLNSILKVSDVFLLPSQQESFGLAALEAMAAGVPVVSSNAGGIPEVNIDGETGFVREIGDVKAMAKAAIGLLKDEIELAKFKSSAKNHALKFDIDAIIPMYEDLYCKLSKCKK